MAWVHPETNGDYRIIAITDTTTQATSTSIATYDTVVQGNVSSEAAIDAVFPSAGWLCLGSTAVQSASTQVSAGGSDTVPFYNIGGDLIASNKADLADGTLTNPVTYRLGGGSGFTSVWTGTTSSLAIHPSELGDVGNCRFGQSTQTTSAWTDVSGVSSTSSLPLYGVSETVSTISGSLSGTISRENTEIWAVGSVTLTADVDFGGVVDVKAALDASQIPTEPTWNGNIMLVGVGGTAPAGWTTGTTQRQVKNTGTGNILLNASTAVRGAAEGVVYE